MANEYFDVIIIGAGLSGIGAACHLSKECPEKSFAIFEGREERQKKTSLTGKLSLDKKKEREPLT